MKATVVVDTVPTCWRFYFILEYINDVDFWSKSCMVLSQGFVQLNTVKMTSNSPIFEWNLKYRSEEKGIFDNM